MGGEQESALPLVIHRGHGTMKPYMTLCQSKQVKVTLNKSPLPLTIAILTRPINPNAVYRVCASMHAIAGMAFWSRLCLQPYGYKGCAPVA